MGPFAMGWPFIYKAKLHFELMHQSCTNNLQAAT